MEGGLVNSQSSWALMSRLPSNNRVSSEILTPPHSSPSYRCALQVLEQWESQQGQSSPAQTSLSAPVIPHSAPFPTHHLHRASVPDSASEALALAKPDPYDLYEKSRAIYESRRKYQSSKRRWQGRWSFTHTHRHNHIGSDLEGDLKVPYYTIL